MHTPLNIRRFVPNLITLGAIAAGLTAIQFALNARWEAAVFAVLVAAVLDAMDGATARLLDATSEFGAQLDSLSDFLAFGIAPAIILYSWGLEESGKVGWIAMIVFAAACALRLARFNATQSKLPDWKKKFFSGVPSPAGAGLALMPIIIWLQLPDHAMEGFAFASPIIGVWTILVAALMVSRIPTFSSKMIHIPAKMGMPALALAVVMIAALIHAPWPTLLAAGVAYLASFPFSVRKFQALQKEHADPEDITDLAIGVDAPEDFDPPRR